MLTKLEGKSKWLFDPDLENKMTEIEIRLKQYDIKNYIIGENGEVNIDGNINLGSIKLVRLPFKFGKVSGGFFCANSRLTSLEGAPKYVGGDFYCSHNNLTSLEGAPKYVGGYFSCEYNDLISLEGAPKYVGGDFFCANNKNQFTKENITLISNIKGKILC